MICFGPFPPTFSIARAMGSRLYLTGSPCKYGHVAPRRYPGAQCVECQRLHSEQWRKANPKKMSEHRKKWADSNPELNRETKRAHAAKKYKENPTLMNDRSRAYKEKNRSQINAARRAKRAENLEAYRSEKKKWESENPDKVKATREKSYAKSRLLPSARLHSAMSSGIRHSLRKGAKAGHKWETLAGYTVTELMAHLESLFLPGMTWENYGRGGWEIDHIIPRVAHNIETPEDLDFQRCWALDNLQPLWAEDNRRKNDRLTSPFQPSLAFGAPANDNQPKKKAA